MNTELFESGSISRTYLKFSLPVVFSGVLTLVYNLVDMYFISKTGNTNLVAGISLCAPIFTLLIAMGDVMGLGGSSIISRLLGEKKQEDATRISTFCLYASVLLGIIIAVILLTCQSGILNLLGVNAETLEHASSYYFWIALGCPFVIFSLTPANLLRTEGNANAAMVGSVMGSIINMILDPIFIFTFGLGAAGAAIATIIGNICTDLWFVYIILRKSAVLSLAAKNFRVSMRELGQVLKIGIPGSITNLMQSLGIIMLNHYLLPYGTDKVAVMGIVSKATMIVIMIMVGFSFGGQPLYGYLYGARNKDRFKSVLKFAYSLIIGISASISLLLILLAPFVIRIFMNDPAIVSAGATALRIVLCGMPFIGITMVTTCVFQSTGKALYALLLSTARQGYFYIALLFILSIVFKYIGVISAQPAADLCTALLALILLRNLLKEVDAFA